MSQMECHSVYYVVEDPDNWEDGFGRYIANGMYFDHRCLGDECMCWERGRRKEDRPLVKAALRRKAKERAAAREQGQAEKPYVSVWDESTDEWEPPSRPNYFAMSLLIFGLFFVFVCSGGLWSFWKYAAPDSWQQSVSEEPSP
jgi:hypothetical protein